MSGQQTTHVVRLTCAFVAHRRRTVHAPQLPGGETAAHMMCPCHDFFRAEGMFTHALECGAWWNALNFTDCVADQLSSLHERRATTVLRHDLPPVGFWDQSNCDDLRPASPRCHIVPFGFTLRAPRHWQLGCSYAFDAWSVRSGNERPPCKHPPAKAAANRLEFVVARCAEGKRTNRSVEVQQALARRSSASCCFKSVQNAIYAQLHYKRLASAHKACAPNAARFGGCPCHHGGYNQVDRAWSMSDISGIFVARESRAIQEQVAMLQGVLLAFGRRRVPIVNLTRHGCNCSFPERR